MGGNRENFLLKSNLGIEFVREAMKGIAKKILGTKILLLRFIRFTIYSIRIKTKMIQLFLL